MQPASGVVVVGLGRFGEAVARELERRGTAVLGIDTDQRIVDRLADDLTRVAVADATDPTALAQLGVPEYSHAVVAIGARLEASVLTTLQLADFGLPQIWAKAATRRHARILRRTGAHHVVLPEHETGERVARLVAGPMIEYLELDDQFAVATLPAPKTTVGERPGMLDRFDVMVVAIKPRGGRFGRPTASTVVGVGDVLAVTGTTGAVRRFSELS